MSSRSDDRFDELPGWIESMWRSIKLGYRAEPLLLVVAFITTVAAAIPDALFALGLKFFAEGAISGDETRLAVSALFLAGLAAGGWVLQTMSERVNRRFSDRATITIESHVAHLQASVASIEHHERPDYLDRLAVLRDQVFALNHMYSSLFATVGAGLRLALTIALLVSVHPALALLALLAVPAVWVSSWRAGVERDVQERYSDQYRLARHLFVVGSSAPTGKEVRVARVGPRLVEERAAAWRRWYDPLSRARWTTAVWQALSWGVFGFGFVGAIVFVAVGIDAPAAEVLLVLAAGSRLSMYVGQTVREASFLRGIWLDASRRLAWLEDYAAAQIAEAQRPAPLALARGIRFEAVSFRYPGSEPWVLRDLDFELPAGTVVAVVGENGAGKSTLVKLLCRMYEPTEGAITVDGEPLANIDPEQWRERTAGAFQDFFRFEYLAQRTVGLGDLPREEDRPAVEVGVGRAGAEDVVGGLPRGLDTQLGPTWHDGVEPSFGQWQKLALARGFMRDEPLVLILDEPTAALDAETEHELFERYAEAARSDEGRAAGRITILVSHRFSTVRMADLILVMDGSRVVEFGSHEELMALDGRYAELYRIQAESYR
jgi:ATP-binding cassette subfamily B protein